MEKEKLTLSQKISILYERQLGFQDQQKRFFAHIESEQRHFQTQGDFIKKIEHNMTLQNELLKKDIQQNSEILKKLEGLFDKHERILLNGGKGLVFQVDRLEQRAAHNREGRAAVIALIAVAISVLGFVIEHINIFSK